MKPVHVTDGGGERLSFPGQIELSILVPGEASDGAFAIFEDIVEPGIGPPRHIHHVQDEVFVVLEGEFNIEVAGVLYSARPGDVAYVPRGAVHAFKNVGGSRGRLRYTFTPAGGSEDMFREFFEASTSGGLDADAMAEIAGKYDTEIVGPTL